MPFFLTGDSCVSAWSVTVLFQLNVLFRQSDWSQKRVTGESKKPLTCFCASQASWEQSRSDCLGVSWTKERKQREEMLLNDSVASTPGLDHNQTLCIVHTGLSHMHEHIHTHRHRWTLISHKPLWYYNKCICSKEKKGKKTNDFLSIIKINLHCGTLQAASLR